MLSVGQTQRENMELAPHGWAVGDRCWRRDDKKTSRARSKLQELEDSSFRAHCQGRLPSPAPSATSSCPSCTASTATQPWPTPGEAGPGQQCPGEQELCTCLQVSHHTGLGE